jgi:molybdopterin converting factor small subunit
MRVRVLFFSVLRDLTGECEVDWELPSERARVADLLDALYARWPLLRDWEGKLLVAADFQYVRRDELLSDGQEVAIMPPVQGG